MPVKQGVAAGLRVHAGAAGLPLIAGLAVLVLAGVVSLSWRRRWLEREANYHLELMALRAKLDRAELFLGAETQIILAWAGPGEDPDIEGISNLAGTGRTARACWPSGPGCRQGRRKPSNMSVKRLRARGESFRFTVTSLDGRHLEIEGRPVGGIAVLRIRDVSGDRRETVRLQELQAATNGQVEALAGPARRDALSRPGCATAAAN